LIAGPKLNWPPLEITILGIDRKTFEAHQRQERKYSNSRVA
jgi:hypothetical protein